MSVRGLLGFLIAVGVSLVLFQLNEYDKMQSERDNLRHKVDSLSILHTPMVDIGWVASGKRITDFAQEDIHCGIDSVHWHHARLSLRLSCRDSITSQYISFWYRFVKDTMQTTDMISGMK